jgi:hypothetical protein
MAEVNGNARPVWTPTEGVDPRDALATSMFGSPGVYAFLVGSGMSSAAGVLTGERVVEDLIRRIARSAEADADDVDTDPQVWWQQHCGTQPRYDTLLESLAGTDAARQGLLRTYFERQPETGQLIEPTAAHHALAELCRRGFVRVVLTTNFDPLIERALETLGLTVQVLSSESQIQSRIPLAHADVTLVKLHGDYRRLGLRNTPLELSSYGHAQCALLGQIFDEYGIVTIGWSAEWDTALTTAIEGTPTRRYPMYWVSYQGDLTETARRVISNRRAHEVQSSGADDFLPDLVARLDRLEARARRRSAATIQRNCHLQPEEHSPPSGWAAVPHLILRVAAQIQPVTLENVGLIGPEEREKILAVLTNSNLPGLLVGWNLKTSDDATPVLRRSEGTRPAGAEPAAKPVPLPPPLNNWNPVVVPGAQSTDQATYRLGGDARVGVSALATIRLPGGFGRGDTVTLILDIGVSVTSPLEIWDLAPVLRDGLVLVSAQLPTAVADILPAGVEATNCEIHLVATTSDSSGQTRINSLDKRLNLSSFNLPPHQAPAVGRSLGFGAQIPMGLTKHEAGELLTAGFRYMVLATGFLDPRPGIVQLRHILALPAVP